MRLKEFVKDPRFKKGVEFYAVFGGSYYSYEVITFIEDTLYARSTWNGSGDKTTFSEYSDIFFDERDAITFAIHNSEEKIETLKQRLDKLQC